MNNPKAELRKYLDGLIHRYLNIKSLHQQLKSIFEWETPARIEALNLGAYFFQLVTYGCGSFETTQGRTKSTNYSE